MKRRSHKAKGRPTGLSAGAVKRTAGVKYRIAGDARYLNASEVRRAADAALERRGLKKRGPLSPREAAGYCLYGNQGRRGSNP